MDTGLLELWEDIRAQLASAVQSRHPFRYMTLATIDAAGMADQRMVVLRDVDTERLVLRFYTDSRSRKVKALMAAAHCAVLMYDPVQRIQLSIRAEAQFVSVDEGAELFSQLKHIKDYTTTEAPGSLLPRPEAVTYSESAHFMAVDLHCYRFEYLKLGDPHHIRALFHKKESITGQWLVP